MSVTARPRSPRRLVALVVVAGLACAAGLGSGAAGYVLRERARERWGEVARHVGEPGYDPDQSDLRYLEVEAWNDWITLALRVAALGAAGLGLALLVRRRQSGTSG